MATATYIPIATQTLGSPAASITFSSIPGTYTDLRLVITPTASSGVDLYFQFNGDTATNYSLIVLQGSGTGANSVSQSSAAQIDLTFNSAGVSATIPHLYTMDVFSYAGSTNKTALFVSSEDNNGSGYVVNAVALWRSTAAITSIKVSAGSGTLSTGTIATLWGI